MSSDWWGKLESQRDGTLQSLFSQHLIERKSEQERKAGGTEERGGVHKEGGGGRGNEREKEREGEK